MNFDFLKDIKSLNYIYRNCTNAEELANTYPESSLVASRKGAEALAKLVYLNSHTEEMERMTFDAILKDKAVRRFIRSRDILDAFYNIKQKGNVAAHADEGEIISTEDAIDALWDLHFVTGEIACKFGLLEQYPDFDENIGVFPEAKAFELSEDDINEQVKIMYDAFLDVYKEQELINNLEPYNVRYAVEGVVDMHEYLYFEKKPVHKTTIQYIQDYLHFLINMAEQRSQEKRPDLYNSVVLKASLTLNSNEQYSTDSKESFAIGVNSIFEAESILLDVYIKGNLREFYEGEDESGRTVLNLIDGSSIWKGCGMYDELLSKKRREKFSYKQTTFYLDAGEINCLKIENGKDYCLEDLLEIANTDILSFHPLDKWIGWSPCIHFYFDIDENETHLEKLLNVGRKHMKHRQNDPSKEDWFDIYRDEDEDEDEVTLDFPVVLDDLNDLQNYLDDINAVLSEFENPDDYDYFITLSQSTGNSCPSTMWVSEEGFAVASIECTEDKFKVVGTVF